MKAKVCHLTSVHPPKDGRIFYKECTSLAAAGYDVTLIAAGADNEVCNGVKIVGVEKSPGRLGRMLKTTRRVYRKALEVDADIYHIHDPELLPYALKLQRRGKKVIFDSHEFVAEQIKTKTYIPRIMRNFISDMYKAYEGKVSRRLSGVIEVCTLDGKDYFDGRCKRRVFITNAPIVSADSNIEMISPEEFSIVHVGGLTFERGISYLAEAAARANCKLVLAGEFSSPEFEKEVTEKSGGLMDYMGVIPKAQVPELLSRCSVGTAPFMDIGQYGKCDTLATKMYDYMLAGLPIIMSDFKFFIKFNQEHKIGLCVKPDSPEDIAGAIEYLKNHKEEARKMGENGRRAVLTKYNWESEAKKLVDFYNALD